MATVKCTPFGCWCHCGTSGISCKNTQKRFSKSRSIFKLLVPYYCQSKRISSLFLYGGHLGWICWKTEFRTFNIYGANSEAKISNDLFLKFVVWSKLLALIWGIFKWIFRLRICSKCLYYGFYSNFCEAATRKRRMVMSHDPKCFPECDRILM